MLNFKRIIACLLMLALLVGSGFSFSVQPAQAEEQALSSGSCSHEDCCTEPQNQPVEITIAERSAPLTRSVTYLTDEDIAAAQLRSAMEQRADTIVIYFQLTEMTQASVDYIYNALFNKAVTHTGVGTQGDFLKRVYGGWSGKLTYYYSGGIYYSSLYYYMTYYTTAAQEQELTAAIDNFMKQNIHDGMTSYEKFRTIYDWICGNVVYDYDHDSSYMLKYTAYAAMVNKTAVCQGYACLLYRMLLEAGIDCRYISGTTDDGGLHGWNIVKMGDYYYNADATWDAVCTPDTYCWCLLNMDNFTDHNRNSQFTTEEFYTLYPMSTMDYDPDSTTVTVSGYQKLMLDGSVNWSLDGDVYLDLNGFDLSGTIELNGYKLYGMDSTTDSYSCDQIGYFSCEDETGTDLVPEPLLKSDITGTVKRYMTIEDKNGYSFHRFYLGITHQSLKPTTSGVGYKGLFCGDEMVQQQVDSFGFTMQLGENTPMTVVKTDTPISGQAVSLRIDNFDADHFGETALSAAMVLRLSDGTVIESAQYTMTLRMLLEALNTNYAALSDRQLEAVAEFIGRYSVISSWSVENLF